MRKLLALGVAVLALTGAASATVIQKTTYAGTDEYTYDDCGFPIHVTAEFSGTYHLRAHKDGQSFPEFNNYTSREVHTNTENGKWFVVRANGMHHDIKSTQVSDTIYEFVSIDAGQPFVLEDSSGKVVARDRGVIRTRYLWDTLGDGQPGGVFLGILDNSVRGPHPGFADDFPFCEIAAKLTGA